ncbi:unnamed protein product [Spirodela intermedia]|uniref:Uncharacterized protein n=1 Tax=Spirodela intermedia TaxID=51605 RepID=A0A7I8IMM7_SPIIN|nr:unnamed protein product [Spirodela intermedia]CAA6659096.1 unnamed protein product [Spirodela intermedia]
MASPHVSVLNLHGRQGRWRELAAHYRLLLLDGAFRPDTFVFPVLLRHCPDIYLGEAVHADAAKRGLAGGADPFVSAALVEMYCRCAGALSGAARQAFDEIPRRRRSPGTPPFRASSAQAVATARGRSSTACPAGTASPGRLSSPATPRTTREGKLCSSSRKWWKNWARRDPPVHGYAAKVSRYVEDDDFVGSVLLDAYGKCGRVAMARQVFDSMSHKNVVAWSSLMASFVREDNPSEAMGLFREMIWAGAAPNEVTLTTALSACAHLPSMTAGKELHAYLFRRRGENPDIFVSSALIFMYGKCRALDCARSVFEKDRDLLCRSVAPLWNTMVSGYVANGRADDAWLMIRSMCRLSSGAAAPNSITLAIILPLCATSSLLLLGKETHCYAVRNGFDRELLCGEISSARSQFELMPEKNRISWTTLIDGYGMHGGAAEAISLFQRMVAEQRVNPDPITFEGLRFFKEMESHGVLPTAQVCASMVDLLARAGRIEEAKEFMSTMPATPGASAWGALLGACRIHGEVADAESTLQHLLALEPEGTGFRGMLDQVAKLRTAMAGEGVVKKRGYSWVESRNTSF